MVEMTQLMDNAGNINHAIESLKEKKRKKATNYSTDLLDTKFTDIRIATKATRQYQKQKETYYHCSIPCSNWDNVISLKLEVCLITLGKATSGIPLYNIQYTIYNKL